MFSPESQGRSSGLMAAATVLEPELDAGVRDEVHDGVEGLIDPVPGPCASRATT